MNVNLNKTNEKCFVFNVTGSVIFTIYCNNRPVNSILFTVKMFTVKQ